MQFQHFTICFEFLTIYLVQLTLKGFHVSFVLREDFKSFSIILLLQLLFLLDTLIFLPLNFHFKLDLLTLNFQLLASDLIKFILQALKSQSLLFELLITIFNLIKFIVNLI